MPRVTFVKKARKDNPVVKAGESYYWWKFRYGGKRYSTTRPKPSQLTQSPFLSEMYSIQEGMAMITTPEDELEDYMSRIDELYDMSEESLNNMPEQLQEGDTGIMLQERMDAMEQWKQDLESIDLEIDEELSDEEKEARLEEILEEIMDCEPSCE